MWLVREFEMLHDFSVCLSFVLLRLLNRQMEGGRTRNDGKKLQDGQAEPNKQFTEEKLNCPVDQIYQLNEI